MNAEMRQPNGFIVFTALSFQQKKVEIGRKILVKT
jgi:hypothetical protein